MLTRFKSPEEAHKYLEKRRKELEKEMDQLIKMKEKGEIGEEEFNKRKRQIEREFIEIMDRLAQLEYIMGQR